MTHDKTIQAGERTQMKREDFTFQSNDSGYMLYFRGGRLGGASVGKRSGRRWPGSKAKDAAMFADNARADIEELLRGNGQTRFKTAINALAKAEGHR